MNATATPAAQVIDSVPGTIRLRGESYPRSQRDAFLRRNGEMVYRTRGGHLRAVAAPDRATFIQIGDNGLHDDALNANAEAAAYAEDANRDLDAHSPRLIDAAADLSPAHAELAQLLRDTAPDAQRAACTHPMAARRYSHRGTGRVAWCHGCGEEIEEIGDATAQAQPAAATPVQRYYGGAWPAEVRCCAACPHCARQRAASSPSSAEDDTDGHAAIVRPASSRFIGNDARNGAEAECWECGDRIINHPSDGTYRHAAGVVERAHGEAIAEDQARDRARAAVAARETRSDFTTETGERWSLSPSTSTVLEVVAEAARAAREELATVRAELEAARADHLAAYQRAAANGAALLAARAELAELRARHDQLLEDLCRPIPEEDGDDVAAEAIVVRWYGQRLVELGRYRETLETIAEPVVPYAGQPVLTASGMRKLAARALETGDQRTGGAR